MPKFANVTVDAWGDFIEQKLKTGWVPYLLTIMFNPLPGRQEVKMDRMVIEIERAYGIFVTRVVRNPRSEGCQNRLPIWLCCPDLPVIKRHKKQSLLDLIVNDGLHYHAYLLLPPWSRTSDIQGHLLRCRRAYMATGAIDRIDVEPVTNSVRYVAGYAFKSSLKGRFDIGENFVLPRSLSELDQHGGYGRIARHQDRFLG